MLTKRLIACFDIIGGMVTKAENFQNNIDIAPADEMAVRVYDQQIDELIFYDITASSEKRKIDIETVKKVAKCVFVPFTVGGGIKDLNDMYEVYVDGARVATGMDAVQWVKRGQELGAGEICLNSIDKDGTLEGYDIDITKTDSDMLNIPVIASGGAGKPRHLLDLFTSTNAQAAIISSMLYSPRLDRNYSVEELKNYLLRNNVNIRPIGGY